MKRTALLMGMVFACFASSIVLASSPDLTPTNFLAQGEARAGQMLALSYSILNQGDEPAVPPVANNSRWFDRIYLSANLTSSPTGTLVAYRYETNVVPAGTAYTRSVSALLPITAGGTNYLILRADSENWIPEQNEENNRLVLPIFIIPSNRPPVLQVSPTNLILTVVAGTTFSNGYFHVWNSGGGILAYAISNSASWLSVHPANGSSTGEYDRVSLSVNSADLPLGPTTAAIMVLAPDGAGGTLPPKTVTVKVQIVPPPPVLAVAPTNLVQAVLQGQNASNQSFLVWNAGQGTLQYAVTDTVPWLAVSPASGTSTGEPNRVDILFDTASLPIGSTTTTLRVWSTGTNSEASKYVTVKLYVTPSRPLLAVSVTGLVQTVESGRNAYSQYFDVWNAGIGSLDYSIASDVPWLAPVQPGGTSTGEHDRVYLTYATSNLPPGTAIAHVTVTGAPETGGSPKVITVKLTVTPPLPALSVAPTILESRSVAGQNVSNQSFQVWNSGGGILQYAITEDASWLSVSASQGTSTGEMDRIDVLFDTASLPIGPTSATVRVLMQQSAYEVIRTVTVRVTVMPDGPALAVYPLLVQQSIELGRNACTQFLEVWNSGQGNLDYTATSSVPWMTVLPVSGTSTGEHDRLQVVYNTTNLPLGTANGQIALEAPGAYGSPRVVPVVLTVTPRLPTPAVAPALLEQRLRQGQNASNQSFQIWNSGDGVLSYTILENASWLSVVPTNGTSAGERDDIQVLYNTAGLPVGMTNATIIVLSTLSNQTTRTAYVTVRLTVTPATPVVAVYPNALQQSVQQGHNAATQIFEVWNSGAEALQYSVAANTDWLSVAPVSGTSTGEHDRIQVTYATTNLPVGPTNAQITVTADGAGGSPMVINIKLTVVPAAPVLVVDPLYLVQTVEQGHSAPSQHLAVRNSSGGTLEYQLAANVPWIQLAPSNGTSTTETDMIAVVYTTANLPAGRAYGDITISAPRAEGSPKIVHVALNITSSTGRVVRVGSTNGTVGAIVQVPITIAARGNENAMGFSLAYNPAILELLAVTNGIDVPNATFVANTNQVPLGALGVAMALSGNDVLPAGQRELALATFGILAPTPAGATYITLTDQPIAREVSDSLAQVLPAAWESGRIAIYGSVGLEGDVAPRPNGNGGVTTIDWVQVGRFVSGVDRIANPEEFQKADAAPRLDDAGTLLGGDGRLTLADWVQAQRYATGRDPLTPASGPSAPVTGTLGSAAPAVQAQAMKAMTLAPTLPRALRIMEAHLASGGEGTVDIEIDAQGNENAVAVGLAFDPLLLRFERADPGTGLENATVNANTNLLAQGRVGVTLALPVDQAIGAGTHTLLRLTFFVQPGVVTLSSALRLVDEPVACEIVGVLGQECTADYTDGSVIVDASRFDGDGDDMPDVWELGYFSDLGAAGATSDADADGLSDLAEFLAGTSPTDPSSVLLIEGLDVSDSGAGMIIRWPSVAGRHYILDRATDLTAGFQDRLAPDLPATPPENVFTDETAAFQGPCFYRISVAP